MITGKFVISLNGKLEEYDNFDDIPEHYDNLIRAEFFTPSEPHNDEIHNEIEKLPIIVKRLMERQNG